MLTSWLTYTVTTCCVMFCLLAANLHIYVCSYVLRCVYVHICIIHEYTYIRTHKSLVQLKTTHIIIVWYPHKSFKDIYAATCAYIINRLLHTYKWSQINSNDSLYLYVCWLVHCQYIAMQLNRTFTYRVLHKSNLLLLSRYKYTYIRMRKYQPVKLTHFYYNGLNVLCRYVCKLQIMQLNC